MKVDDNYYEEIDLQKLQNYFTEASIASLLDSLEEEAKECNRLRGLGVFLFEKIEVFVQDEYYKLNLAITAEWKTLKDKTLEVGLVKMFIYKTKMPDEVLDQMNKISEVANDVKWRNHTEA